MQSLDHAVDTYKANVFLEQVSPEIIREAETDLISSAMRAVDGSYLSIGYPNGSSGYRVVSWMAQDQYFCDWGNNFWLYGPQSHYGNGRWVLEARHPDHVFVQPILDASRMSTRFNKVQELWRLYWQMMFADYSMSVADDCIVTMHIVPLDVENLAAAPKPRQPRAIDYLSFD